MREFVGSSEQSNEILIMIRAEIESLFYLDEQDFYA